MRRTGLLISVMVLLLVVGCSPAESNTDQVTALKQELVNARSKNDDLVERVNSLEESLRVNQGEEVPGAAQALKETVYTQFDVIGKLEGTELHPFNLVVTKLEDEDHNTPQLLSVNEEIWNTVEVGEQYTFEVGIIFSINGNEVTDNHRFELIGMNIIE